MYQASEQLIELNKAQFEAAARFAATALQGAERMLDVHVQAAKSGFADTVENVKALAAVKGVEDLAGLKAGLTPPSLDKATTYARGMCDAALQTQAEFGRLLEEQVAEMNKRMVAFLDGTAKNAPPGADVGIAAVRSGVAAVNAAYGSLAKIAQQFTEVAQSNLEFAAAQAKDEAKKAKKTA